MVRALPGAHPRAGRRRRVVTRSGHAACPTRAAASPWWIPGERKRRRGRGPRWRGWPTVRHAPAGCRLCHGPAAGTVGNPGKLTATGSRFGADSALCADPSTRLR